jgi:hypothetical protein
MNSTPMGGGRPKDPTGQHPIYQNKMGFGFAGMPEQYQPGMMQAPEANGILFQDADVLDLGI